MIKFYCRKQIDSNDISVHIVDEGIHIEGAPSKRRSYAEKIVFREANEGDHVYPAMYLDQRTAQHIVDELWDCGIRPTEGAGSAGSLAATERHLKDLQRLVFYPPKS